MKYGKILCSIVTTLCFFAVGAVAMVPNTINYQGTLTDTSGNPIDGTRNMRFSIYEDSTGSSVIWSETHDSVAINDGLFRVTLGSNDPLPSDLFNGNIRWITARIHPDGADLSPRQPLVTVPYSFKTSKSDSADMLDGQHGSYYRNASNLNAGTISESRLPQNAIDGSEIEDGSLTGSDISNGSIYSADIANSTITGADIATGTITSSDISDGTITGTDISSGSIYGSDIANETITGTKIANGTVTGSDIDDGTITGADISNGSIYSADIATNSILGANIHDGTVTGADIATATITASDLAANCVEFSELDNPLVLNDTWEIERITSGAMLNLYNDEASSAYCDIAWMRTPNITATYHWTLWTDTRGGIALYAQKGTDDNEYCVYIEAASSTSEGLYVDGTSVGTGPACTVGETPTGPVVLFSTHSTEEEFTTNGTAQLNNGSATISFDRIFSETISPNVPVRVITTPIGSASLLYVDDITNNGCTVKSGMGDPNVEFNWIAIGRRKGYDQRPDITIPDPEEIERIRELKEAAMEETRRNR